METHYDVLNLPCTCSAEEIKAAYKRLVLKEHPDKMDPSWAPDEAEHRPGQLNQFHKIQEAYHVLQDPDRRARYDAQLQNVEHRVQVHPWDSIDLAQMDYEDETSSYTFKCRCGDMFVLCSADLPLPQIGKSAAVLTECRSCANVLEVLVDALLTKST
jgi:diphthamide biosynthesis protein 4